MKNIINIILINTKKLKKRVVYINSTLTYLKNIIEKNKYQCNLVIIHIALELLCFKLLVNLLRPVEFDPLIIK